MSDILDLLMKNGLSLEPKLLSFFMQTYRAESSREAFKVCAKVFADHYGLDYERMLSDVDRMPEPSKSYFPEINKNWFYSQVESKGVGVSIPAKPTETEIPVQAKPKKVDVSIKLAAAVRVSDAFFKSMHVSLPQSMKGQKGQGHAESKAQPPSNCG